MYIMSQKKWLVYFINSENQRDGQGYIWAQSKEEALELYRRFYNVPDFEECRVVAVFEGAA
jgi:hypothetical protein